MQPVHILADQEVEKTYTLQLHQRHMGLCGPCTFERGVELGGQTPLLHRPDAMRTPEGGRYGEMQRERQNLGIREKGEQKKRQTEKQERVRQSGKTEKNEKEKD